MKDYQTLKVSLEEKLGLLQNRLGKITRDLRQAPEPDSEERTTSRENDEVLEYLDNTGREELDQLQAAIARIDAGTYGICTQCGKEVPDQRLAALPYIMTCVACAR